MTLANRVERLKRLLSTPQMEWHEELLRVRLAGMDHAEAKRLMIERLEQAIADRRATPEQIRKWSAFAPRYLDPPSLHAR